MARHTWGYPEAAGGKLDPKREREHVLNEIDAWRRGDKATPGLSTDGERYALNMRLALQKLYERLDEVNEVLGLPRYKGGA